MKKNKYCAVFLTIILCMNFISCEKDSEKFAKEEYNIHIDEAGTLRLLIPSKEDFGGYYRKYKSLKLTGQINQEDLDAAIDFMVYAETIDMKDVSIVEGERLDGTKTPKNVITSLGTPTCAYTTGSTNQGYGTLILPNDLEEYWGGGLGIKNITFPNTLRILGDFSNPSMTSIVLPDGVTEIGDGAFGYSWELTSITLSTNLVKIGGGAFCVCKKLTDISIPDKVTEIGHTAFLSCDKLQEVWLSKSLTQIGYEAFRGCSNLKKVHVKSSTPPSTNNRYIFDGGNSIELFVPKGSRELYRNDPYWRDVQYITEE